jgi:uncharacterized membrane protein
MLFWWSPLAMIPVVLVLAGMRVPQPFPYAWHKLLHVLGAVIFVGNLVTQAVWLVGAQATRNPVAVRASLRTLNTTDLAFMGPGMFLLFANGAILSQAWGGPARWSWMVAALLLLAAWGTISMPLMWLQVKMFKVVSVAPDDELLAALAATTKGKGLGAWLVLMLLLPLAVLVLMVVKPRLW